MCALHRDAHKLSTRSHTSALVVDKKKKKKKTKTHVDVSTMKAAGICAAAKVDTPRRKVKFTAKTTNQVLYVYRGADVKKKESAPQTHENCLRLANEARATVRVRPKSATLGEGGGQKRHFLRSYFHNDQAFRAYSTSHADYADFKGKVGGDTEEGGAAGKSSGQPRKAAYMHRRDTRNFHSTYVDHFQGKQGRRVDLRRNVRPVSDVWKWSEDSAASTRRGSGMGRTIVLDGNNAACPALRYVLSTVDTPTVSATSSSTSSAASSPSFKSRTDLSVQT
jgi:hypothetical protein